jgi:hypothetical protein
LKPNLSWTTCFFASINASGAQPRDRLLNIRGVF